MQRSRLDRTIAAWQPLSPAPLGEADAREIVEHVLGFFEVLRSWQEREQSNAGPGAAAHGQPCLASLIEEEGDPPVPMAAHDPPAG